MSPASAQDDPISLQGANDKASQWISAHPGKLKVTDEDSLVKAGTYRGDNGTVAVAYERTHRGLPVFGGDFVVVTDANGAVLNASVAQRNRIDVTSLQPTVGAEAAQAAAGTRFDSVSDTSAAEKIVYALGADPRLAWKVKVSGTQAGERAGEDVYVDATSGEVIDYTVTLAHGTGDGWINGPDPLPLRTTGSGTSYSMTDPEISGLHCGQTNLSAPKALTGTDDAWGNGVGTSIETGCADALYGVQTMDAMLSEWLGRDGPKGDGTSWPIYVGLNDQNAFYCHGQSDCGGRNEVWMGKNPSGQWVTSLDVVGHEYGHGVDDYTPSGISRRGTQEFVGDVMGTLTEFYDNQTSEFDPPDYLIGEEVNLGGSGEIRNMTDPAAEGDPVCYTTAVDTMGVHTAAGPGDHWFYLLANGGTSKCDSTNVTGIGPEKAGKIFYNAMLMKTTSSGYQAYRKWTLQAAKNLYTTGCTEFNAVKAAWDAVNVPVQTGEATCTGGGTGTVSVTNPGNKTGTVGTALSSFTLSASGGTSPYTWSATGLPGGVTISSTGTVSGTPNAAGTFNVTATARDSASTPASGSTSFTITVSGGGTPSGNLLLNPGFESGAASWAGTTGLITTNTGRPARTGSYKAWFGGNGSTSTENLTQTVTIPATATAANLSYWIRTDTAESGSTVYDTLKIQVVVGGVTSTLKTFSNVGTNATYTQFSHSLLAHKGKAVTVKFLMNEDYSLQTSFVVDDTAVSVS